MLRHVDPPKARGRLSVVLAPEDVAVLDELAGGRPRTKYARRLIKRLVTADDDIKTALPDPVPLPDDKNERTRLDVRLSSDLRRQLKTWCGRDLRMGDAIRGAIHADRGGLLTPSGADEQPSNGARKLRAKPIVQMPRRSRPLRARSRKPDHRPGQPAQPPRPRTPRQQRVDAIADRVRHRQLGRMIAPRVEVEVTNATVAETEALVDHLEDDPGPTLLASCWSAEVEIAIAELLADGEPFSRHHVVLGALPAPQQADLDDNENFDDLEDDAADYVEPSVKIVGLPNAPGVADELAGLVRKIGRDARAVVQVHRLAVDGLGVVRLLELGLELR